MKYLIQTFILSALILSQPSTAFSDQSWSGMTSQATGSVSTAAYQSSLDNKQND